MNDDWIAAGLFAIAVSIVVMAIAVLHVSFSIVQCANRVSETMRHGWTSSERPERERQRGVPGEVEGGRPRADEARAATPPPEFIAPALKTPPRTAGF